MACNTCNKKTEDCGCKATSVSIDSICNPIDCGSQECSESFPAECILYTGDDIICDATTIVTSGDSVAQSLANIVQYFCDGNAPDVPTDIVCGATTIVPSGTTIVDALPLIVTYFCNLDHAVDSDILCGLDTVVTAGSDLTAALTQVVTYFCDAIAALPTVTLANGGVGESLVKDGTGPTLETKGLAAGTDISITQVANDLQIAFTGTGVTQQNVFSNIYDSGWVAIPDFNGTFGVAPIVGRPSFELRVVDRVVFIQGQYIVPLDNPAASGNLITLYSDYPLPTSDKNVWTTAGGGMNITTDQQGIITLEPIIPVNLRPDRTVRLNDRNVISYRPGVVNAGPPSTVEYLLTAILNTTLATDGKIVIATQKDIDDTAINIVSTPGGANTQRNSEAYHLIGKHALGDAILTYEDIDYAASVLAGSIVYTGIDTGQTYPFSFDGKQSDELGGFQIVIQASYPLPSTVTLTDIQTAIASM